MKMPGLMTSPGSEHPPGTSVGAGKSQIAHIFSSLGKMSIFGDYVTCKLDSFAHFYLLLGDCYTMLAAPFKCGLERGGLMNGRRRN